jgi:FMN phosphatase YigB (HAD superfamily)
MRGADDVVFLCDVDNTLLDNDRVQEDLQAFIAGECGTDSRDRYWRIFEDLRRELGYADYLGALQRYRLEADDDPRLMLVSSYLMDYPFAERVYPGALAAVAHLAQAGTVAILSDGDVVFQPLKIRRSGLWAAVQGQVLIYIHKEQRLGAVERQYPARHYVMVDDKVRILAAMKEFWRGRLTTVFPRQGHYALDAAANAAFPVPDVTIEHIAELASRNLADLVTQAQQRIRG